MKERNQFCRILALFLAAVMLLGVVGPITASAAEETWALSDSTEIFWVKNSDSEAAYNDLAAQVGLFSAALNEKYAGRLLPISYGEIGEADTGDIIIELNRSAGIAKEGYTITVANGNVYVTASDAAGLQYGCNALIKQLIIYEKASARSSAPWVAERGLSLDNGRKYYSVEWIKQMIRELAWADMNTLVLHFTEEMGLGIESKLYPWLAGRDGDLCTQAAIATDNTYLTQDEVIEIIDYAKQYHVEIIPSFDSPGHMNYIVKKFNEKCAAADYSFTYDGKTYTAEKGSKIGNYYNYNGITTAVVPGSRNGNYSRGIDVSNEVAVAFTRSLIEEYATFFNDHGCTKFDIGGDELLGWGDAAVSGVAKWKQLDHWKTYAQNRAKAEGRSNWASAVAYDAFLYYMNDLNDLVRSLGYTSVRMWNDDALRSYDTGWNKVVELDTNIDIWFWTTGNNTVWTYAIPGYQVYNILSDYNYYAMTSDYFNDVRGSFTQSYPDQIYNEWTPYTFDPTSTTLGTGKNMAAGNPNVLGSSFGIWSDNPSLRTQAQVMDDVDEMLRAHGAKAWKYDTNKSVNFINEAMTYSTFKKIGVAPTITTGPEIYQVADLTELAAAVENYNNVDGSVYTADSYAAYTSAVEAGKALLAADKPLQADVDAAVAAIVTASENLVVKPPVTTAALEAAIANAENVDRNLYTEASFKAYEDAISYGVLLLQYGVYTQEEVDAATAAINEAYDKLEKPVPVDTTALENAIEAYKTVDGALYTAESFVKYTAAVNAGQKLLDSGAYTQADVNAAVTEIENAKTALQTAEVETGVECFISGSFKSTKVYVGKVATINMSVIKGTPVDDFEIENDLGETIEIVKTSCSTKKSDRDNYTVIFKAQEHEVGERTYVVYGILADGTRSSDYLTLTITVK